MQAEGMTLTRFFVTDSRCCPSRASILTGRYPHNHGVLTNSAPDGGYGAWVRQGDPQRSLGVTLQMAGYRTGYAGKYLNGYPASAGGPPDPGWEDFFGGSGGYDGWHYRWNHNGTVEAPVGFTTDVISAHASEFIRGAAFDRRPFLLTLATFAAHRPYVPAPRDRLRFRGLRLARDPAYDEQVRNPPRWLGRRPPLSPRQRRLVLSHYRRRARSLAAVDRMVGAVRAELFAQGLADNTYVVFSSDNGYHHGQHRLTVNKGTAFDSDVRSLDFSRDAGSGREYEYRSAGRR